MSYLNCIFLRARLIALLMLLAACTKTIHYEEEVQLSTGTTIVLQRSVKGERFGEPGAGGGQLIEQRIEFAVDGKQYVWADDIPPLAIDIYKGSLFLAAMPHTIGACLSHGSPSPPFVFFPYHAGHIISPPKNLVAQYLQIVRFIVINCYPKRTILRE